MEYTAFKCKTIINIKFPLSSCWAATVRKVNALSLDSVVVCDSIFCVYSRVGTLPASHLKPFNASEITINETLRTNIYDYIECNLITTIVEVNLKHFLDINHGLLFVQKRFKVISKLRC